MKIAANENGIVIKKLFKDAEIIWMHYLKALHRNDIIRS